MRIPIALIGHQAAHLHIPCCRHCRSCARLRQGSCHGEAAEPGDCSQQHFALLTERSGCMSNAHDTARLLSANMQDLDLDR